MDKNNKYIQLTIDLANKAYAVGEVPVGAVIVQGDAIVSSAYNQKETTNIATRHAELIAIEEASRVKGDWRLDDCIMYVSLEPCMMCKGAIMESRIKQVVYAAKDMQNKCQNVDVNIMQVNDPILIDESTAIIKKFFANMRK
ncbi:MAG: nucleoside deaminase [Bacilli bacterium]|nr:nucleoside deaminase [Bacilli bacterium]